MPIPNQRGGFDEVAAVANQIPVARKTPQLLHRSEINQPVLEDFVRRIRAVNHLPFGVMPDNGRAAEPFQDADLDFLRLEGDQPIKARGKTVQSFTGQTRNQIRMEVNAGATAQELEMIGELGVILPPADETADLLVEGLDADLELQRAGRKPGDDFAQ